MLKFVATNIYMQTISPTREDYLRAILRLEEDGKSGTTEIARYLDLSKSTVSERMRDLMKTGLVSQSSYSPIRLTAKGRKIAEELTRKHRTIEVFLYSVLKVPRGKVHQEAH